MTVPRGTAEPEPVLAADLFGSRIPLARRFTEGLVARGEELGLIGPFELPRIWTRHILNSALLAPLLSGRVGDVGSGAGLPGIVLAIARPDLRFVLIEPMERRTAWLEEQRTTLALDNVQVLRARAEEGPRRSLDVVMARAVGALSRLIPLTAPLARDGGELILMKGAAVERELDQAAKAIAEHRLTDVRIEVVGTGMATEATRVFRARVN